MITQQSIRAQIIERRTYLRPTNKEGTEFETPRQAWRRVINHQKWLWVRAKGEDLNTDELAELEELYGLFLSHKVTVSGRTRWLGGTEVAKRREASQFNCAFTTVQTVHDVVDTIWLLLQGCGVGFRGAVGVLNGFVAPIDELVIIRSEKILPTDKDGKEISDPAVRGCPDSVEWFDRSTGTWTIRVGDSAEAWAKFFGKLLAGKYRAKKLIVDFGEIRPAGYRLSGYGWISSGDEQIAKAVAGIFKVLNRRAGKLLTAMDIHDIETHLGTILSSRRSAEISLYEFDGPEWKDFALAKKDSYKDPERKHREMANNSLLFTHKPTRRQLTGVFKMITEGGGSEPGFINAAAATKRAPYFRGVNPCAEILLGDKSFCNLVETILCRFNGDEDGLHRAHRIVARANYRQTCVNLDDGILQRTWHELNEFLRLCGVGVTGVIGWEFADEKEAWQDLRSAAHFGANGMADELGLPRAQLVTTVKPSGTQSKASGHINDEIPEGIHKPLGRYIFNNVIFPAKDPLVNALINAGYQVTPKMDDATAVVIKFPVEYNNIDFDTVTRSIRREDKTYKGHGDYDIEQYDEQVEVEVNLESAVDQLDRYKLLMDHYVDHNCSITISYDQTEVPDIIDWLMSNWDSYVGVSWLYRNDPSVTAEDLGFPYLPQEVVDERTFHDYTALLGPVKFRGTDVDEMLDLDDCSSGACPIR